MRGIGFSVGSGGSGDATFGLTGKVNFVVDVKIDEIDLVVIDTAPIGANIIIPGVFIKPGDESIYTANGGFLVTAAKHGEIAAENRSAADVKVG